MGLGGWGLLRRVAGWAGPEASLSHEAAKPDYAVGCAWNFGWRAGLSCA